MDIRRLLKITGILLALLIVFLIVRSFLTSDDTKPSLDQLLITNQRLIELSDAAKDQLGTFDLQVSAANVTAVISSDNQLLTKYYSDEYGRVPKPPKDTQAPVAELEDIPPGGSYDSKFIELASALRKQGQQLANAILAGSTNQELSGLLTDYLAHLSELFQ